MDTEVDRRKQDVAAADYSTVVAGYQSALQVVDDIILKNYLTDLKSMQIVPLDRAAVENNLRDNVLFFKITEMVYEKDEFSPYKFASVFNALSISENSVFVIIDSNGIKTDFYMGIRSMDEYRTTSSLRNTVENALKGQFPGTKTQDCTIEEMEKILASVGSKSVSAVSCVANNRMHDAENNQNFVQGLEKLVLAMQGEKYTGIILANNTMQKQLNDIRHGYEQIYTQLSPFASTQNNYSSNFATNFSISQTHGYGTSDTHTKSTSETEGTTETHGTSKQNMAGKIAGGVSSAASVVGMVLAPFTAGVSLAVGGVIAGAAGGVGSMLSKTVTDSTTKNHSVTNSSSDGHTNSENHSNSQSQGESQGNSSAVTFTIHDKTIENILGRIDKQLKRLDEFESLGMYECAAYFLSDDQYAAEVAATTYKGLMRGENSGVETAAINSWGQDRPDATGMICEYVKNFIHPVFQYRSAQADINVTPCTLVSGSELAIHMGLPRKSVCGLPVMDHASFGKEITVSAWRRENGSINLGHIFNMGSEGRNRVKLDLESLSMHTFITGATGSGKSNTIYELLRQLDNHGVRFLVVEPAKGEYKNVFGGRKNVSVYGTNVRKMPLLRLNPFSFPEDTHVLEHIDRLVEIFNACWPMYAAMPAVLKDAVERAYINCGWNLTDSSSAAHTFPTFVDLMNVLPDVVKQSGYSADTQNDYIGALFTRIKSLTNGINGQIFCSKEEISADKLFDENVIVDLSRVGSMETKSLLMGVLVLKLQEHRMAGGGMNADLRHVTVLEEAHNLLRRTSDAQTQESSNLQGKSVEMIANAIAEMRTYGEGFIIADQAPGLMDPSVIRNTNTKIIMRLPDGGDRELVGKAASLNDDQIIELAKLPLGVAAVYQNDWLEPVLCRIKRFEGEQPYAYTAPMERVFDPMAEKICCYLLNGASEPLELEQEDADKLANWVTSLNIALDAKKELLWVTENGTGNLKAAQKLLYCMVKGRELIQNTNAVVNVSDRQSAVDAQIEASLNIPAQLAAEIRRQIFAYAAGKVSADLEQYHELMYYGGVR